MNSLMEITQLPLPSGFEQVSVYCTPIPQGESPRHRRERAAVDALLEAALGAGASCRLGHHPSGAPYIIGCGAESAPSISITHSRRYAMLAVTQAGCSVGIDAESTDRSAQLGKVAARFLSPSQREAFAGALPQAWTLKEALYKAMLQPGIALEAIPLPQAPLQPMDSAQLSASTDSTFLVAAFPIPSDPATAVALALKK